MKNKKVLFVCRGNWFRSQMAAALYNKLTNSTDADSAGTCAGSYEEPEGQTLAQLFGVHTAFFELMEKHGMFIRENTNKRLQPYMIDSHDVIVSMAEESSVPDFLKNKKDLIRWEVENPPVVYEDIALKTFNVIKPLVEELINKIKFDQVK